MCDALANSLNFAPQSELQFILWTLMELLTDFSWFLYDIHSSNDSFIRSQLKDESWQKVRAYTGWKGKLGIFNFRAGKRKVQTWLSQTKKITNFSSIKKFSISRLSEKFFGKKVTKKRIIFIVSSDFFNVSLGGGGMIL